MFEDLIKTKSHGAWSVTAVDKKFHPKKILTLKDKKYIKTYFKEEIMLIFLTINLSNFPSKD